MNTSKKYKIWTIDSNGNTHSYYVEMYELTLYGDNLTYLNNSVIKLILNLEVE